MNGRYYGVPTVAGVIIALMLMAPSPSRGQVTWMPRAMAAELNPNAEGDDPAYATYREGYQLILEERWNEARKQLSEVIAKHRNSAYIDDAHYWIAYSWRTTDVPRAIDLYTTFVKTFPTSSYYDDAIADMTQLRLQAELAALPRPPKPLHNHHDYVFRIRIPAEMERLERELARVRTVARPTMKRHVVIPSFKGDSVITLSVPVFEYEIQSGSLDPKLRVRVDALRTLSRDNTDRSTFHVLRNVAFDIREPVELRETAVEGLAGFSRFDVQGVLFELAQKDTNERILAASVESLARTTSDKKKSLESLTKLFTTLPAQSTRQLGTTLFAIAEIGDDRATDFIIHVAQTHPNFEMRSDAVFYLGNIGSEKARTALRTILTGK